jgi:hypothetical protein
MAGRALIVWGALLVVAIANGLVRVAWIIPRVGDQRGHQISTLTLSASILLVTFLTIAWLRPASRMDALAIGAMWVAMTLAFEFLGGHYLFGKSWDALLAEYNLLAGRIWILVLLVTAAAPLMAAASRLTSGR